MKKIGAPRRTYSYTFFLCRYSLSSGSLLEPILMFLDLWAIAASRSCAKPVPRGNWLCTRKRSRMADGLTGQLDDQGALAVCVCV